MTAAARVIRHSLVIAAALVIAWLAMNTLLHAFDNAAARALEIGTLVVAAVVAGIAATRLTPPRTPWPALASIVVVEVVGQGVARALWAIDEEHDVLEHGSLVAGLVSTAGADVLFGMGLTFALAFVVANRIAARLL